jgi:hypothetical protein
VSQVTTIGLISPRTFFTPMAPMRAAR